MRRDLGNEVIVAIAAVAVLAFAVMFGILISLSDGETVITATPGQVVRGMADRTPSPLPLVRSSQTAASPEETDIVSSPSRIPATVTGVRRTATPAPVMMTQTPSATLVPSAVGRVTSTRLPRTPQVTPTVTRQDRPLATTREALPVTTAAPTPVWTPSRTRQPTLIRTVTMLPPTVTLSPQPSRTRTPTALPAATNDILPTPSPPAPTHTAVPAVPTRDRPTPATGVTPPAGERCVPPAGWFPYVVQPGNTLFSLARAVSSSVTTLSRANCLADADHILAGDVLFLPRPLASAPPTSDGGLQPVGCTNSWVQIISPSSGQRVSGIFVVVGSATLPRFEYYKLEVRADSRAEFQFIERYNTAIENGVLGEIDAGLFPPGLYWVRLVVVDNTGNVPDIATCIVPIYFD